MIPILEQEDQARQQLASILDTLSQITPESLVRRDELGSALDFSQGTDVFRRTLDLFRSLRDSNLDNVPVNVLQQLTSYASDTAQVFKQIQTFNPAGQNNPAGVRDNLISQVAEKHNASFSSIAPIIAYSVRKGTDFDLLERQARATVDELIKKQGEFDSRAAAIVAEAQATLDQVRRVAAEAGVAQHAVHFKTEANEHLARSKEWLWATAVFGALPVGFAVWAVYFYASGRARTDTGQAIQMAVAKLLLFSALSYAVVWCGRLYRAQWHNYVVNKHRQNALSTFEAFVKAASDEQTKNAVLMQATHCIFSPQVTGFAAAEADASPTPQILEIVRAALPQRSQPR